MTVITNFYYLPRNSCMTGEKSPFRSLNASSQRVQGHTAFPSAFAHGENGTCVVRGLPCGALVRASLVRKTLTVAAQLCICERKRKSVCYECQFEKIEAKLDWASGHLASIASQNAQQQQDQKSCDRDGAASQD
jgi:hypothetical protein